MHSSHVNALAESILRTAGAGERSPAALQRIALMELSWRPAIDEVDMKLLAAAIIAVCATSSIAWASGWTTYRIPEAGNFGRHSRLDLHAAGRKASTAIRPAFSQLRR